MKNHNAILTNLFLFVCAMTATHLNSTTSNANPQYSATATYPTTVNCPAGQTCNLEAPLIIVNTTQPTTTTQTKNK